MEVAACRSPEGEAADTAGGPVGVVPEKPPAVVVQPDSPAWLSRLPALLRPLVETLGGLALALVLVVFMLLKREDLRNRLIRLVGHGRMTVTTKAVDDAGQRISRFLLMQLIINASFGLVLSIGLLLIQVPHALLWGLLAAILRYVPYLGSWITAAVLIALSLAIFPGWVQPLLVLGLIVVLELVTANVVEPRLFGHSMGVSEVALLVAAAFWAFLWGPVGLVLSSPLTVCLVVLGKYVPQLEFLDVLLGDEPSLDADVTYYQRLLARDQDEATQLVLAQAKTFPPEQVYDELLVPALNYVKQDRERDDLTEADEQFVLRATREIVEDLGERQTAAAGGAARRQRRARRPRRSPKVRILGCPGHDEADGWPWRCSGSCSTRPGGRWRSCRWRCSPPNRWPWPGRRSRRSSASGLCRRAAWRIPATCASGCGPGCPRRKSWWGAGGSRATWNRIEEQLREAGADQVETTLLETRDPFVYLAAGACARRGEDTRGRRGHGRTDGSRVTNDGERSGCVSNRKMLMAVWNRRLAL